MKIRNVRIFLYVILTIFGLLIPITASAIPMLGVAPGAPGSSGTYLGSSSGSSYLQVFADSFLGGGDGFIAPPSGGLLTIWFGKDNGNPDENTEIFLCTDASLGDEFKFQDQLFTRDDGLAIAGYKAPTYGVSLGSIDTVNPLLGVPWVPLELGEFGTGKKEFYSLTGKIEYTDLNIDEWLYAATVKRNSPPIATGFSPKTTSATAPEPASVLLLASGLAGLVGVRRKFRKS